MIDHQLCVRISGRHLADLLQSSFRHQIDREVMLRCRGQHAIDPGICRVGRHAVVHHDADRDRAVHRRPLRDGVGHLRIIGIYRLDHSELVGVGFLDRDRVAGVPMVHGVDGDEQRPIDADGVHRLDHVLGRHLRRSGKHRMPRPARMVALVAVNLDVDRWHEALPFQAARLRGDTKGFNTERSPVH